jgi:hypothetical protein
VRLAGRVGRIGIGIAERLGNPHDRFLVAGVVVENLVALLDRPEIPLRHRVLHTAPDGLFVLHQLVEVIVRRLFLE